MILSILVEFVLIIIGVMKTLIFTILFGLFNIIELPATNYIGIAIGYIQNFFPDDTLLPLLNGLFLIFIFFVSLWAIKKVNDLPFIP